VQLLITETKSVLGTIDPDHKVLREALSEMAR
jgi:hypothetical protein